MNTDTDTTTEERQGAQAHAAYLVQERAHEAAQAQAALTRAVQVADQLGLSARAIATAAGLTHPTVAKILRHPEKYGGAAS